MSLSGGLTENGHFKGMYLPHSVGDFINLKGFWFYSSSPKPYSYLLYWT